MGWYIGKLVYHRYIWIARYESWSANLVAGKRQSAVFLATMRLVIAGQLLGRGAKVEVACPQPGIQQELANGAAFLEAPAGGAHAQRGAHQASSIMQSAGHFQVFHQRDFGETTQIFKDPPGHKLGLVAKHETPIGRQPQAVEEIEYTESGDALNLKSPSAGTRLGQGADHGPAPTRGQLSIGMTEDQHFPAAGACPRVHLDSAPWPGKNKFGIRRNKLRCTVLAAAIHNDDFYLA